MSSLLRFLPDPELARDLTRELEIGRRSVFVLGDPVGRRRLLRHLALWLTSRDMGHNMLIPAPPEPDEVPLGTLLSDPFFGVSQVIEGADSISTALRTALRMDPDVLILETLDAETMPLALRAGLTGHRILAACDAADAHALLCQTDPTLLGAVDPIVLTIGEQVDAIACIEAGSIVVMASRAPTSPRASLDPSLHRSQRRYRVQRRFEPRPAPEPIVERMPRPLDAHDIEDLREHPPSLHTPAWVPLAMAIEADEQEAVRGALGDADALLVASISRPALPPSLAFACPAHHLRVWFSPRALQEERDAVRVEEGTVPDVLVDLLRERYRVRSWEEVPESSDEPVWGTKLGGTPGWQQADETPDCPQCAAPMALVLQWSSNEDVFEGLFSDFSFYLFRCREHAAWRTVHQCG